MAENLETLNTNSDQHWPQVDNISIPTSLNKCYFQFTWHPQQKGNWNMKPGLNHHIIVKINREPMICFLPPLKNTIKWKKYGVRWVRPTFLTQS